MAPDKRTWAQQMALAAALAPPISFMATALTVSTTGIGKVITGVLVITLVMLGFVFGVIAIVAYFRSHEERILVPSVVGVCLNAALLALWLGQFAAARSVAAEQAASDQAANLEVAMQDGWAGGIVLPSGATVSAMHVSAGPISTMARSNDVFVMSINNSKGNRPLVVDGRSAIYYLRGGNTVAGPPWAERRAQASPGDRALLDSNVFPMNLRIGERRDGPILFAPKGLDFHALEGIELIVDGVPLAFPGRFLTRAEKTAARETAKQVR